MEEQPLIELKKKIRKDDERGWNRGILTMSPYVWKRRKKGQHQSRAQLFTVEITDSSILVQR